MERIGDKYAVLAQAVTSYEAEMARQLLSEHGMPCLVHGPDFDRAELGAAHDILRRVDVLVAPADLERARVVLEAAWGPGPQW